MDASIDFAQPLQSVDASIDSAIDPEVVGESQKVTTVRVRKCGEFNRTLAIPPNTTVLFSSHST